MSFENDELCICVENFTRMSAEDFLAGIQVVLLNEERNKGMKEECPYVEYLDLIGVFKYKLTANATIRVTWEVANKFGVTAQEMLEAAIENLHEGTKVFDMRSILGLDSGGIDDEDMCPMMVFTNRDSYFSAAILLLNDKFRDVADKWGSDLIILPSSIHEVIVTPKREVDLKAAACFVRSVNESEVVAEDFLSNNIYEYVRATGKIRIAV